MVTKEKSRLLRERNTLLKEVEMITNRKKQLNKKDKEDLLLIRNLDVKTKRINNEIRKINSKLK